VFLPHLTAERVGCFGLAFANAFDFRGADALAMVSHPHPTRSVEQRRKARSKLRIHDFARDIANDRPSRVPRSFSACWAGLN